jgi:uncharacterized protein YjbI with pentapeptide repeats
MILVAMTCSTLFLIFYAFAFHATQFLPAAESSSGSVLGVKTPAITVAAGLFGGVLFVAFTVLKYRSHVQSDERLAIEQRADTLRTAEHFSERFAQAAELLGSERSATRMGGVYALAALADEWKENRQQCIDLLCGYLRTPIELVSTGLQPGSVPVARVDIPPPPITPRGLAPRPENSSTVSSTLIDSYRKNRLEVATQYVTSSAADEVAVRKAVISSIARGTRRELGAANSWSDMTFDLSRCFLDGLDFSECYFSQKVDFNWSIFGGSTNFRKAHFAQNAQFDGCIFTGRTWFSGTTFAGHAWFRAAEFRKEAAFGATVFQGGMLFSFAHFEELPHLRANELGRSGHEVLTDIPIANFDGISFMGDLSACPDVSTPSIWDSFSFVQLGYRIICERDHPDRPLGVSSHEL